jgi:hypothetical protein
MKTDSEIEPDDAIRRGNENRHQKWPPRPVVTQAQLGGEINQNIVGWGLRDMSGIGA